MFKTVFCCFYFSWSLSSEGLIIGRNFEFQNGLIGLDIKNCLKQLKTASTYSPWAYIRQGLLSEGFLRLRFGGLIFGRAYFLFIYLFVYFYLFIYLFFFLGGEGGLIIGILRYK